MTVDLTMPDPIAAAVDAAVEAAHIEQERTYLGASVIGDPGMGDPCERRLWLRFRWAFPAEKISGRILRLFQTGHEQEARIIAYLRAAGMTVEDRDPATGEQWEYEAVGGHFKCHPDGFVTGVPGAPKARHALEIKTHNAASFKEVTKHGVEASKPEHVAQMDTEMEMGSVERALYVALNKNDEAIYSERVKSSPEREMRLLAKAERIIVSDTPAPRIAEDASRWPCKLCRLKEGCHGAVMPRRNCRTCLNATPTLEGGGTWRCELPGNDRKRLTVEEQRAGCPEHRYLPGVVKGRPVDADEADNSVVYVMEGGTHWTDTGPGSEVRP